MPHLTEQQLVDLHARPLETCDSCHTLVRWCYCRQCDEFFTAGHHPFCALIVPPRSAPVLHDNHRTI